MLCSDVDCKQRRAEEPVKIFSSGARCSNGRTMRIFTLFQMLRSFTLSLYEHSCGSAATGVPLVAGTCAVAAKGINFMEVAEEELTNVRSFFAGSGSTMRSASIATSGNAGSAVAVADRTEPHSVDP